MTTTLVYSEISLRENDEDFKIKVEPVPTNEDPRVAIQARTLILRNPKTPTREDLRPGNFSRHARQWAEEGFQSAINRPYRVIGGLEYLSGRELTLATLGQLSDSAEHNVRYDTGDEDGDEDDDYACYDDEDADEKVNELIRKKTRRKTISVQERLLSMTELKKQVRSGYGLFRVMRTEDQIKQEMVSLEENSRNRKSKHAVQPPRVEEDDHENFSSHSSRHSASVRSFNTATSDSGSTRRRIIRARPYTPMHNNLNVAQFTEDQSEQVFRQLCCLHWILEYLTCADSAELCPISQSWLLQNVGAVRQNPEQQQSLAAKETEWNRLRGKHRTVSIPVPLPATPSENSEVPESSGRKASRAPAATVQRPQTSNINYRKLAKDTERLGPMVRQIEHDWEMEKKFATRTNHPRHRPFTAPANAQLSARLLAEARDAPSSKHVNLCSRLRKEFTNVTEERAITVTEQIEESDSRRMELCQLKLSHLKAASNFHAAAGRMRGKAKARNQELEEEERQKKASEARKKNWYYQILGALPESVREKWQFKTILMKLEKYSTWQPKRSIALDTKFMKCLTALQKWLLLHPDVVTAVEFCRERVLKMAVEQYEEYFSLKFPHVKRPELQSTRNNAPASTVVK